MDPVNDTVPGGAKRAEAVVFNPKGPIRDGVKCLGNVVGFSASPLSSAVNAAVAKVRLEIVMQRPRSAICKIFRSLILANIHKYARGQKLAMEVLEVLFL